MPLSREQRRRMDIHIQSNTIYNWHMSGTNSESARTFIVDRVERSMDSGGVHDLFLPNCFIECDISNFWFRMAAIASGGEDFGWHELEYGPPISRDDLRQRYVYTWTFQGWTYKFYTKTLNDGHVPELVWYVCRGSRCLDCLNCSNRLETSLDDSGIDNIESGNDTDSEEIMLWSV